MIEAGLAEPQTGAHRPMPRLLATGIFPPPD